MGRNRSETRYCQFEGCKNAHRAYGLCMAHHLQREAGKPLTPLRNKKVLYVGCKVQGCTDPHYARGYCQKDYAALTRTGELQPLPGRERLSLSDADVRAIRSRYAAGGISQEQLADAYGVSRTTVNRIVHRQAWGHVS